MSRENAERPTVEGAGRARILSDAELRVVVDTAGAVIGEPDSDGTVIWIADILETARHERAWRRHYDTMATITTENNQKLREQRDAFKGAFQILFNCHHGDEATCGCREDARVLIAAHAAPSNVGHDGPPRPQPDPPKAQHPSGDVERVVRAARAFVAKYDVLESAMNGAFAIQAIHGLEYTGDNWGAEITELRAALRGAPAASGEEK